MIRLKFQLENTGEKTSSSNHLHSSISQILISVKHNNLDRKFDLVIADNVWEHLKYPYRATKNVFDLLNQGGYFLVIVPFLIRVHNVPIDCSRWTEDGLKFHLERKCGFKIKIYFTNSWGNKKCVASNLRTDDTWSKDLVS